MKKCFLHIGNFKTGSTSLQRFLFLNKGFLKKNNFHTIYEKNYFSQTIHNQKLFRLFDQQDFKRIKKYFSKVSKNNNVIISSEFFSCMSYNLKKIKNIKKFILRLGYKPIIIFYYRADKSYLYSLYAQQMTQRKNILIDNVKDFKNKVKKFHYYFNKKNNYYYLSQKYYLNNRIIIKNWKKIFNKNFFYYKFEKDNENKIFYNFIKTLNLDYKSKFIFPEKKNITRKIKFWNLRRFFYYFYLSYYQSKIFKYSDLNLR